MAPLLLYRWETEAQRGQAAAQGHTARGEGLEDPAVIPGAGHWLLLASCLGFLGQEPSLRQRIRGRERRAHTEAYRYTPTADYITLLPGPSAPGCRRATHSENLTFDPCGPGGPNNWHWLFPKDMTVVGARTSWLFSLLSCSLWLSNKY